MRRWLFLVSGALLLAACHHKEKPVVSGSDTTKCPVSTADDRDSLSDETCGDSVYTSQRDTAEPTDFLFPRRKTKVVYKPEQLVGEWHHGNKHEQNNADGSGLHWDTDDDVAYGEALPFTWEIQDNLLELRYPLKHGGMVVRQYEVTFVDEETLVYRDAYGESYLWDKE